MHLYLDTTDGETIKLALAQGGKVVAVKTVAAKHRQSEKLLREVERLLQKVTVRKVTGSFDSSRGRDSLRMTKLLKGIIVTKGPGKFTATRIGVTTANALAYALQIPVAGVTQEEYADVQTWIAAGKQALGKKKWSIKLAVEPQYGGEPNISKPKAKLKGEGNDKQASKGRKS